MGSGGGGEYVRSVHPPAACLLQFDTAGQSKAPNNVRCSGYYCCSTHTRTAVAAAIFMKRVLEALVGLPVQYFTLLRWCGVRC